MNTNYWMFRFEKRTPTLTQQNNPITFITLFVPFSHRILFVPICSVGPTYNTEEDSRQTKEDKFYNFKDSDIHNLKFETREEMV